jgi:hypothetical protein
MKLYASFAEAIREGAKIRPQTFGVMRKDNASCAFGAGYEAMNGSLENVSTDPVEDYYRYLTNAADCPIEGCDEGCSDQPQLTDIIIHLNDGHQWTREAIADWLETEEEKLGFITVVESENEVRVTAEIAS